MVLQDRFRASQRRACRLVGQNRITQRRPVPVANIEEHKLRQRIRELARRHIRWGRRLVYRRLRIEGWSVNHKRVQRIWREEGLQRPLPRKQKRSRPADGSRGLLRAEYPHHVWAIDFQFDQTMDGRRLKLLNIVDEYSRMCLAIRVGRRSKAIDVIDSIEELLKQYPAPTHLRMDNGPEFIAHALQEWCTGSGSGAEYIPPGSPWENPFVESFKSRFRDEFLLTKSDGGHVSSYSHRYRRQKYWQSSTGWSTIAIDRTRLSRGIRLWKSSSSGRRPDHTNQLSLELDQ